MQPQIDPLLENADSSREREDLRAPYLPHAAIASPYAAFLDELVRPPGRYRSPRPTLEKFQLEFEKRLAEFGTASGGLIFPNPAYPVPANWQAIFEYLRGEGVITSSKVFFEPLFHDTPKIFALRLFSVFDREPTDGISDILSGHSRGVSFDLEEAFSKVIGEFLERYPLTVYDRSKMLRASIDVLTKTKEQFLNPFHLSGFADWQKEKTASRTFSGASNFFWVQGRELLSDIPALIPAQLVFWNYDTLKEPFEPYLRQAITNGAAGHFTSDEAVLAGMYENIQRDAFLIHWLNSIAPPRIDLATITNSVLKELIADLERYGFEVIFLNTTLDLEVPSSACVLVDASGKGPRIAVGGGCGPDIEHSLIRSLTEAMGVYHWLRLQKDPPELTEEYIPFDDPSIGQAERLLLWSNHSMFKKLEPFLSGPIQSVSEAQGKYPTTFAHPAEELRRALDVFRTKGEGYEVYVYGAKHALLDTLGYHSVRVTIPALIPLYLNERAAPLGSARLRTAVHMKGHTPASVFNPLPHPFP